MIDANDDQLFDAWFEEPKSPSRLGKSPEDIKVPATSGQKGLWVLDQLNPELPLYTYPEIISIKGRGLDVDALKRSFSRLVERQPILRTNYIFDGNELWLSEGTRRFLPDLIDFSGSTDPEESSKLLFESVSARPFDLESELPIRVQMVKISEDFHQVLLLIHHIALDNYSVALLHQEISDNYREYLYDRVVSLDPLELSFKDYAYHESNAVGYESQRSYWKTHLDGLEKTDYIVPDAPGGAVRSHQGKYLTSNPLKGSRLAGVQALTKELKVSSYVFFASLVKILLWRNSGSSDVAIGTPVINRKASGVSDMVGFFTNTVILRSQLDQNASFRETVLKTRDTVVQAMEHSDIPFEEVVRALNPERYSGRNPLFDVMVSFGRKPEDISLSGCEVTHHTPDLGVSKFGLTFQIIEKEQEIEFGIEYLEEMYRPSTVEGLLTEFNELIDEAVVDASKAIARREWFGEVGTATAEEAHDEANSPTLAEDLLQTFIANSERIAIVSQGESITYGQLETYSKNIARNLSLSLGLGQEPLGVFMGRSWKFVVTAVGIMRAGRAYLPLDPSYPQERLQYMIDDCGAAGVVVSDFTEISLSGRLLAFDQLIEPVAGKVTTLTVSSADLAYIIYTSGSTGRPKGVPINQGQIAYSTGVRKNYYKQEDFSFLLLSSFSFDSSVAGMFWSLTTGSKLVIGSERIEQDLDSLTAVLETYKVTHTLLLPSLYETLLDQMEPDVLGQLSGVIVAGETCGSALVYKHRQFAAGVRLFNEYGPTEATVWCTVHEVGPGPSKGLIPIGRPIEGTKIILLDGQLQPVPPGVPGEICIVGPGVAHSYLREQDRTNSPFVDNLELVGNETMYRTGDLGKWGEDNLLYFLGRKDRQVKINGFRIEVEEIEHAIKSIEGIKKAVVIVVGESERQSLYTYYEGDIDLALDTELRSKLPQHMIPSGWTRMDRIPLLPNGKINRNAILELQNEQVANDGIGDCDLSPEERTLKGIWSEVLNEEQISINDNFFQIGGTSLLSIRIIAKARELGLVFSPVQFFSNPTIRKLAVSLKTGIYERPSNTIELRLVQVAEQVFEKELISVNDQFVRLARSNSDLLTFAGRVRGEWGLDLSMLSVNLDSDIKQIARAIEDRTGPSPIIRKLIPLRAVGASPAIFCIHTGMAFETFYEELKDELKGAPVYGVLSTDPKDGRQNKPENLEKLAEECYKEIRIIQPTGPVVVVSFSISSVLLFEMARQRKDEIIAIMIGPPLLYDDMFNLQPSWHLRLKRHLEILSRLEVKAIITGARRRLEEYRKHKARKVQDGSARQQGRSLMTMSLNYKLVPSPIILYTIRTSQDEFKYRKVSWSRLSTNFSKEVVVPGTHDELLRQPVLSQVAGYILTFIAERITKDDYALK